MLVQALHSVTRVQMQLSPETRPRSLSQRSDPCCANEAELHCDLHLFNDLLTPLVRTASYLLSYPLVQADPSGHPHLTEKRLCADAALLSRKRDQKS